MIADVIVGFQRASGASSRLEHVVQSCYRRRVDGVRMDHLPSGVRDEGVDGSATTMCKRRGGLGGRDAR